MRKEIFNVGLTICAIAPLLVGCGANNAGGTVEIPMNCPGNGQVLTTDSSGQFQCVSLPPGVVSIPKCDPNFDALTTDGSTLSCDSRNNETSQTSAAITPSSPNSGDTFNVTGYQVVVNLPASLASAAAPSSSTLSPSPGARKRFVSTPCWRV